MASCLYSGGAKASAGRGARIEALNRSETSFLGAVIGILLFFSASFLAAAAVRKTARSVFRRNGPGAGLKLEPEADAVHAAQIVIEIAVGLDIGGDVVAAWPVGDQHRIGVEDVLDRQIGRGRHIIDLEVIGRGPVHIEGAR